MIEGDRFRLLDSYCIPPFECGRVVHCEVRGPVMVLGLSDGPIPWPVGKRGRATSLVVYGGLAEAVRREAVQAVCRWWGVSRGTVWKWRKALGVGLTTE